MQKIQAIFEEARISEKSFGSSLLIEESDAPVISHSERTSQSAIWWRFKKSFRSAIAAFLSLSLFLCRNSSPKIRAITGQNLFCACM